MKQYPSISSHINYEIPVYIFDKLDGSNMRAEWTRKSGFKKYGRRNGLLDDSNSILKRAIPLFQNRYEKELGERFEDAGFDKATAFFEFFGPNSFAGWHDENDQHEVLVFDVDVYKHGLLGPKEFLKLMFNMTKPNLLHHGTINHAFEESIRNSSLEGVTFEGVVCKSNTTVFKIKTRAWLEKLKIKCAGNEQMFKSLS